MPTDLTDAEVVRHLQKQGTNSNVLYDAFTGWANLGKHTWGKSKVSRCLEKTDGVVAKRGTGNRMFLNLVLNDAGRAAMSPEEPYQGEMVYDEVPPEAR